jgi:predicted secreted protein
MTHFSRRLAPTLLCLLGATAAAAQTLPPPQNVLQLAADASAEVVQDTLMIALQATRDGAEAAAVQSQLRQTLDAALVEARKAARPGQLEVRTGVFSIYPRYATKPTGGNAIVGWQGRAELLLEGRDIAAISQLAGRLGSLGGVSGAGGAGGVTVARVQFSLSREAREAAEADVAARAIARFKGRAEAYAKQFGFGGYSLREVSVGGGDVGQPVNPVMLRSARAMAAPSADEVQPVEAGKATVSVSVSGSIQLSPR